MQGRQSDGRGVVTWAGNGIWRGWSLISRVPGAGLGQVTALPSCQESWSWKDGTERYKLPPTGGPASLSQTAGIRAQPSAREEHVCRRA